MDDDIRLRAFRKSRLKCRIADLLSEGSKLTIAEIAAALDTRPILVQWALEGQLPYYTPERAMRRLGLVERSGGRYRATALGRTYGRNISRRRWLYRLV